MTIIDTDVTSSGYHLKFSKDDDGNFKSAVLPHGETMAYSCIPGYFYNRGNMIVTCNAGTLPLSDITIVCARKFI